MQTKNSKDGEMMKRPPLSFPSFLKSSTRVFPCLLVSPERDAPVEDYTCWHPIFSAKILSSREA
jgi:hypothetical protein